MSQLPLLDGIAKYVRENNISFCMPGHKGGKGFVNTPKGVELYKDIIKYDITEVEGVDNLHLPTGIIKEAQSLLSDYYGSQKSYFLVNGSTSGNMAMIFSAFQEGDKVILERNCHKSIYNALIMRKLVPVYIENNIHKKFNAPLSINEEHYVETIESNPDAVGVVLTYPNYYGICSNLPKLSLIAKNKGLKVLVDSAHGAHFNATDKLPNSAVNANVDMVVMSAHKTLPSLTQTAFLHIVSDKDIRLDMVDFYVSSFLSTSPSYILMCSMDYARYYLKYFAEEGFNQLIKLAEEFKAKINNLLGLHVIDKEDIKGLAWDIDLTRYVINTKYGSGSELLNFLRQEKIQGEMNDASNVVLIFTPFNKRSDFEKLFNALEKYSKMKLSVYDFQVQLNHIPKLELLPWEANFRKIKSVYPREAEGMICGRAVIPYPPGVPVIMPGEIIDRDTIDIINYYMENKIHIIGIEMGKIYVIL